MTIRISDGTADQMYSAIERRLSNYPRSVRMHNVTERHKEQDNLLRWIMYNKLHRHCTASQVQQESTNMYSSEHALHKC